MKNALLIPRDLKGGGGTLLYLTESGILFYIPGLNVDGTQAVDLSDDSIPEDVRKFTDIDIKRARLGKISQEIRERRDPKWYLMLVNTNRCNNRCSYCYVNGGPRRPPIDLDLGRIREFVSRHSRRIATTIVYGGESLMVEELPKLLREAAPESELEFVTGMGFEREDFLRRIEAASKCDASFTLSIDPYPDDGKGYHRRHAGAGRVVSGMDWFYESLVRIAFVDRITKRWAVRPTISNSCWDFRGLRELIKYVLCISPNSTGRVKMNVEPEIGGHDDPVGPGALAGIQQCFDEEVEDIVSGGLKLQDCPHLAYAVKILDPRIAISPGGCYSFWNRFAVGPDGQLSFCNETVSYGDSGFAFGTLEKPDRERYADTVMRMIDVEPACAECGVFGSCGVVCPVRIKNRQVGGCDFAKIKSLAALRILANVDNVESINLLLPARLAKLREWSEYPPITREELMKHADWLLQ